MVGVGGQPGMTLSGHPICQGAESQSLQILLLTEDPGL